MRSGAEASPGEGGDDEAEQAHGGANTVSGSLSHGNIQSVPPGRAPPGGSMQETPEEEHGTSKVVKWCTETGEPVAATQEYTPSNTESQETSSEVAPGSANSCCCCSIQ